jgi:hypothetical protein
MAGMIVGAIFVWMDVSGALSIAGLGLVGFFAGPVFPTLISSTPGRVGDRHTANAVGFQIGGAVLGQSLVPAAVGVLSRGVSLETVGPSLVVVAITAAVCHEAWLATGVTDTGIASQLGLVPSSPIPGEGSEEN